VVTAVTIELPHKDCQTFVGGIFKAISDQRLSSSIKVLGPKKLSDDSSRVILTVPLVEADQLLEFLTIYRKKRSLAKKSNLIMRVDPYALS
jgi:hypothetical protein